MIEAGYYSFFSWNGYGTATDFVGLRNYEQVLGQRIFHSALWHNLLVIVVSLLIQLPLAMAMALIVAEKIPGNNVFRTIFFLPCLFIADVGITDRGANILMAEEFLDFPQILSHLIE